MRDVRLSVVAERSVRSLNPAQYGEFTRICETLSVSLIALERAGFVTKTSMFGGEFRYFENHFPFLVFFRIESDDETENEVIAVQVVVPAFTDPRP